MSGSRQSAEIYVRDVRKESLRKGDDELTRRVSRPASYILYFTSTGIGAPGKRGVLSIKNSALAISPNSLRRLVASAIVRDVPFLFDTMNAIDKVSSRLEMTSEFHTSGSTNLRAAGPSKNDHALAKFLCPLGITVVLLQPPFQHFLRDFDDENDY